MPPGPPVLRPTVEQDDGLALSRVRNVRGEAFQEDGVMRDARDVDIGGQADSCKELHRAAEFTANRVLVTVLRRTVQARVCDNARRRFCYRRSGALRALVHADTVTSGIGVTGLESRFSARMTRPGPGSI